MEDGGPDSVQWDDLLTSERGVSLVSCLMNLDRRSLPDTRDDSIGVELIDDEWSGDGPIRGPKATMIVNADDWGRDAVTTDACLNCARREAISSVSAMVFMEDSERASVLAQEHAVDTGLHLNLTTPFSAAHCPLQLIGHQQKLCQVLTSYRIASVIYHPLLASSFEYVVRAQLEEYQRLYGAPASRVDGHHHMHLCANVFFQKLLPEGVIVRRNLSFGPGEKPYINRVYRRWQDSRLAKQHCMADFFFDLMPVDPLRLERIRDLASRFDIEIEVHPGNQNEYKFLIDGGLSSSDGKVTIAPGYLLRSLDRVVRQKPLQVRASADSYRGTAAETMDSISSAPGKHVPHICVCICTYKRLSMLKRLLTDLSRQETRGLFTYSAVVADNDETQSSEALVADFRSTSALQVKYCVEPRRGISVTRNRAVENGEGEFLAFIDDDEFPAPDWLLKLFKICNEYKVDGVLGPVKRHFDEVPPAWLQKSRFYERTVNPTGMRVDWQEARTGNVLLRKTIVTSSTPFRPELKSGEDQDFFRRKISEGYQFIWCANAEAFETVPPVRWKRAYMLRKALMRGESAVQMGHYGLTNIAKSIVAVPLYLLALPFAQLLGHHHFMTLLVKLFDHLGKLLALVGIHPVRGEYV